MAQVGLGTRTTRNQLEVWIPQMNPSDPHQKPFTSTKKPPNVQRRLGTVRTTFSRPANGFISPMKRG